MSKVRLVIADDSEEVREIYCKYFSSQDKFDVVAECADGYDALECVGKYMPDALILDMIMPELDGYGVLKALSAFKGKRPYIIVVSQLMTDACVAKALASGADYFMMKPAKLADLSENIYAIVKGVEAPVKQSNALPFVVKQRKPNASLDEKLAKIFISVGIPAHIKGYQFLREAIKLAISKPEIINSITKQLYPSIAEQFDTSSSKVERAIRHAIEVAWNRGRVENFNSIFGLKVYSNDEKPTNGEFIALIADKMLIEGA